ncbi:YdcF family protein [Staphylococcus caeli]|uniref:YdcF family protein n=1 Tax=Staphylococcus caeli TaxID=2201815 RepID=UPI003F566F32
MDYIITLGSGIRSEEVTPLLKSRLDKGIEYYYKNNNAYMVVSGGQGPDEPIPEALAMARYLYKQGIPEDKVIIEDKSTTTLENMKFSKEKIEQHIGNEQQIDDKTIVFTTNNYHVLRAAIYSKKANLKAHGIGSPTAYYFLPTALIREYIALIVMNKIGFGICFVLYLILATLLFIRV